MAVGWPRVVQIAGHNRCIYRLRVRIRQSVYKKKKEEYVDSYKTECVYFPRFWEACLR